MLALVHYRYKSYAKPFGLLGFAAGVYAFGYAFEIMRGDPAWTFLWLRVEYFGLSFIGACWLWLSLDFTRKYKYLKTSFFYLIFGISAFFLISVLTNNLHHLFYTYIGIDNSGPFQTAEFGKGPLYIMHSLWLFTSFILSTILYILHYIKWSSTLKKQSLIMLIGSLWTLTGFSIYTAGLIPWHLDAGPIIVTINGCIFAFSILRVGLLDISPIARERIFESMGDGVVVTDLDNVILDFNAAAQGFLPMLSGESIGKSLSTVASELKAYDEDKSNDEIKPFTLRIGNFIYFYEIRKYPIISKPNKEIGIAWYIRDVTEQYKLSAQLKSYAEKDELTGIWNRRKWVEMARMEIIRTQRYRRPFTVMSIDIDYFKKVNDTLGHEAGDKALISITDTISSKIRNIDIFGRIGGEEFAIIFPEIGREEAYTVANRLLAGVSDNKIHINGKELSVTISIGITTYDGGSDMTLEELIRKADNAMYEAKKTGRNKVCFAA